MTSRNAGSVRTRAVGSALYNMCVQMSSIISSNVSVKKPSAGQRLPPTFFGTFFEYARSRFSPTCGNVLTTNRFGRFLQIYRDDDKPLYRTGNKVLLGLVAYNIILIVSAKLYYRSRNASREKIWRGMSDAERLHYLETTSDSGNKRYVLCRLCDRRSTDDTIQ